jgi:hypothetical protein
MKLLLPNFFAELYDVLIYMEMVTAHGDDSQGTNAFYKDLKAEFCWQADVS